VGRLVCAVGGVARCTVSESVKRVKELCLQSSQHKECVLSLFVGARGFLFAAWACAFCFVTARQTPTYSLKSLAQEMMLLFFLLAPAVSRFGCGRFSTPPHTHDRRSASHAWTADLHVQGFPSILSFFPLHPGWFSSSKLKSKSNTNTHPNTEATTATRTPISASTNSHS